MPLRRRSTRKASRGTSRGISRETVKKILGRSLSMYWEPGGPRYPSTRPFVRHADGTYTYRRTFFYPRPGYPEKLVREVKQAFRGTPFTVQILGYGERWRDWPKDSYHWVRFKVKRR